MSDTLSNRLQPLKFNSIKEFKLEKEGNHNGIVGDEQKAKARFRCLDFSPLHPTNDST